MENIGILQEMGIPIEEAVELLQKSKSIEEAIDLYLTRPKFTFSGATLPKRPTVVQKILEPDWKVEGYQQKIKEYHTGLVGLQGVSISPLIQVLARWSEASQILFQTKFTFEPIVSTLELKQVPFSQLQKELQRVIAGLKFSSRNALGCVWAGIAFMSYRKYMGTSFPQNIQESWTFLLHALNLQSLFDLAFLNIYEGGNKKTLAGIPLNGGIVYESFDQAMGNGYLFESGSDIPAGKLIPFFCSDSLNEIPPVLFADRYLLCNREQVEILRQERLHLRSQLDALQVELRSYLDTNIHAVQVDYSNKGAIDFLKQQNQDTQELAMFQSNIREGHLKCMLHIEALNSDYNRVFDRPDLQKYPLHLKAIFIEPSPSEFSVCIQDNGTWFHFFKDEVRPIDFRSILSLKMKISMLWYFYAGGNSFPIPEALQGLVEQDNRSPLQ